MDGKQIGLNACAAPRIGASDGIDDGEFVSRHTGNRSSTVGCHQQEGVQEHKPENSADTRKLGGV